MNIDTIFMVEDETLFILKMQDILEMLNFDVDLIEASTTEEAIDILEEYKPPPPQCYFLDLNLKGSVMNGLEFGKKIRSEQPDAVIMMVSTSDDKKEIQEAEKADFNGWIVKSGDLAGRLEQFKDDFAKIKVGEKKFTLYN